MARYRSMSSAVLPEDTWQMWIGAPAASAISSAKAAAAFSATGGRAFTKPSGSDQSTSESRQAASSAWMTMRKPVFAAVFAYFILGETLSPRGVFGAVLILMGMLIAEVDFKNIFGKDNKNDIDLNNEHSA